MASELPELSATIAAVRDELEKASLSGSGRFLHFDVEKVEMEFVVDVERRVDGEAGIRIGVVSIGAKGGLTNSESNRIRLTMRPFGPGGGTVPVGDSANERPDGHRSE